MGSNISVPHSSFINGGLRNGMEVEIHGQPTMNCDRFSINLCAGPTVGQGDVGFHFNPRFGQGCVVRNHRQAGNWGAEEKAGGMPLTRGRQFVIKFQVDQHGYKVFVNQRHFCDFTHRLPMQIAQYLYIDGGIIINSLQLKGTAQLSPVVDTAYCSAIQGGVNEGMEIVISGQPKSNSDRFSINLCVGPTIEQGDVAFHFNPRFNQGCVVRNHYQAKKWGAEETAGGIPFMRGATFTTTVQISQYSYKVFVDGRHFCDFAHRLPKEIVQYLYIKGDVSIGSVNFVRSAGSGYPHPPHSSIPAGNAYPPHSSMSADNTYVASASGPIYKPPVPVTVPIQGGFHPGKIIYISGVPNVAGTRFYVNLVCGSFESSDIALHFDVRFNYGNDRSVVIRAHRQGGVFGSEERYQPYFPFVQGANFEMMVLCEPHCIKVAVNNQHFIEFNHRIAAHLVDHLQVTGDVKLSMIRFQ
ncbi:galectin [Plakobranchus ocellatus]|uniref:Galectin n=1 Tax=Plakobranchus ocellatus TaxID=259542 RepID=A0AAV3ZME7_9GAST|nr:galectin [Plakobranchus ocellatus]